MFDNIYKKTARPNLIQPTFVTNYPEDLKPLAAPNGDGTANCYQLLIGSWEVVNAYGELIDPQVQRDLFKKQAEFKNAGDDEAMMLDEAFLQAMEQGFPPMTGFGMGVDRIIALLSHQPNLRDVVLFPTMKPEANSITSSSEKRDVVDSVSSSPSVQSMPPGISREAAWELVKSRCDFALQRHLAYVASSMESFAKHLGHTDQDALDTWYLTGLLHDIDWNDTINNPDQHCGRETMEYLQEHGVSEEICVAIQTHHVDVFGLPIDTDLKKALLACDEISGFSVAVALMRPTKMMGMKAKSIVKKIKDKKFAAAVDRDHMRYCEEFFSLPQNEFLPILIPGWEKIAGEWELS